LDLDGIGTLENANLDEMSDSNVNVVSRYKKANKDAIRAKSLWKV